MLPQDRLFWSFISYSHTHRRWACWLQRSLEGLRIPASLRKEHRVEGRLVQPFLRPFLRRSCYFWWPYEGEKYQG